MANTWLGRLIGTMGSKLGIGGPNGVFIAHNVGAAEVQDSSEELATLRAARILASGETLADVPTLLDSKSIVATIQYSFDGASAPSPGANTNKFGFCHTTGGSYTAGDVVYDDGVSLLKMPASICRHITSAVAVSGVVSLIENGFYSLVNTTWTLTGDGGSSSVGQVKSIEVAFDDGDTPIDSTTSIPSGARVLRTRLIVTEAFTNTPTILVTANGSVPVTLMATADNDPETVGEYHNEDTLEIDADGAGIVRVAVGGTPDAGAGSVIVEYTIPSV